MLYEYKTRTENCRLLILQNISIVVALILTDLLRTFHFNHSLNGKMKDINCLIISQGLNTWNEIKLIVDNFICLGWQRINILCPTFVLINYKGLIFPIDDHNPKGTVTSG